MAVVKKISELTAKGSNIGANDLVIVGVSNGTDYDLKSVTGNQLVGAAVAQTITNGVTTTAPSQDAVKTALDNKVDKVTGSRLITSAEATVLSNTSGTNTGDQDLSGYATDSSVVKLTGNQSIGGIKTFDNIKLSSNTFITPTHMIGFDANNNVSTVDSVNARYALGLGTLATQSGTFSGTSSGTNTGDQTFLNARVQSVTSSATVTPTSSNDLVTITAQAVGLTLANPTGTFTEGQALMIRIKDNGTARTIAFDTNYRAIGVTLPTTTVISKTLYLGIIYNSTDSKWDIIGYNLQA